MRPPSSYAANARFFLHKTASDFRPTFSFEQRLEAYRTFCLALQVRAYVALLSEADPDRFFLDLKKAAVNWKALLEHVRDHEPGRRVPASMNTPLLGALAGNQFLLARELAACSARQPTPPEYEDEFLAAFFYQQYLLASTGKGQDTASLESLCDGIDAYLGEVTPRTETLRALARQEQEAFWSAFRNWSTTTEHGLRTRAEEPGAPYSLGITRYVWLEGLAVLQLARARDWKDPYRDHPLIPELARHPAQALPDVSHFLLGRLSPEELDP